MRAGEFEKKIFEARLMNLDIDQFVFLGFDQVGEAEDRLRDR
jgi:hypothetical protein